MARYFGGFRDRLKKRSKNIPVTVKDVEWIKVATTFTWSPARRDYKWLEPEDYLSSFLNSNPAADLSQDSQGDGSVEDSMEMAFTGNAYDGSDSLIGRPSHQKEDEDDDTISYVPPFDFVGDDETSGGEHENEAVLRPNIDVPAELPLLDEYKLEIVSALLRRGIRVGIEKVKLPRDLAGQLNDYHEGHISIDSYEIRARLQQYKKQVIESYEHFNAVIPPLRAQSIDTAPEVEDMIKDSEEYDAFIDVTPIEEIDDERLAGEQETLAQPATESSVDATLNSTSAPEKPAGVSDDYESFILSSLNRLEAAMDDEDLKAEAIGGEPADPGSGIRNTRTVETPQNTSDKLAEGASNAELKAFGQRDDFPSSYADDSWLVLPVDSRKAGHDLEHPEALDDANIDDEIISDAHIDDEQISGEIISDEIISDSAAPEAREERMQSEPGRRELSQEEPLEANIQPTDAQQVVFSREDEGDGVNLDPGFDGDPDVLESTRADSSELLKALNTINSRFPDASTDEDLELNLDIFREEDKTARDNQPPAEPGDSSENEPETGEASLSELLLKLRNEGDLRQDNNDLKDTRIPVPEQPADPGTTPKDTTAPAEASPDKSPDPIAPAPDTPAPSSAKVQASATSEDAPTPEQASAPEAEEGAQQPPDFDSPSFEEVLKKSAEEPAPQQEESAARSIEAERARYIEEERKKLYSLVDDSEAAPAREADAKAVPPAEEAEPESPYNPEELKVELARLRASVERQRKTTPGATREPTEKSAPPAEAPDEEAAFETPAVEGAQNLVDPEPGTLDLMDRMNGEVNEEPAVTKEAASEEPELLIPGKPVRSFGSIDLALTRRLQQESEMKAPDVPAASTLKPPEPEPEEPVAPAARETPVREESSQNEPGVSLGVSEPVFSERAPKAVPETEKPSATREPVQADSPSELTAERIRRLRVEIEKQTEMQSARNQENPQDESRVSGTESVDLHSRSKDQRVMAEPQITEQETASNAASEEKDAVSPPEAQADAPAASEVEEGMTTVVEATIDHTEDAESDKEIVDDGLVEADEEMHHDISLAGVLESLAFATEDPIPLKKIARIYAEILGVRQPTEKMMRDALKDLNDGYAESGRSYRIKEWAGGVRMASHPTYARFIRAIYQDHRPKKLSRTLMETLAIIAYSQPTTKPEIDFVRGVDSDYAVRKLLELGLIDIVGRSDSIGRPLLYGTSERFLEQFGLSEIEALPKLREVEDLLGDPAFKKERLQLLALEEMEATSDSSEKEEAGDPAIQASGEAGETTAPEKEAAQPDAAAGEAASGASD